MQLKVKKNPCDQCWSCKRYKRWFAAEMRSHIKCLQIGYRICVAS